MGVRSEADDLASKLHVPDQQIPVQLRSPQSVGLVGLGVDLQSLAVLDKVLEDLVEQPREVPVQHALLRVRGVAGHIVEVSHYVKVPEPSHLPEQDLKVAAVGFLPVLSLVVRPEIRVGVLNVVDRRDDLVELVA